MISKKNVGNMVLCLSAGVLLSCGKKKEEAKSAPKSDVQVAESPTCDLTVVGCAATFFGTSIAPTVPDGDYAAVIFNLGNSATQNAGSEKDPKVPIDNKSKLSLTSKNFLPEAIDLDYMRRLIANRYFRGASDQDPIWDLIRSYDEAAGAQSLTGRSLLIDWFKEDQRKPSQPSSLPLAADGVCPSGNVDLGAFGGTIVPASTLAGKKACIIVKDTMAGSVTAEEIKTWTDSIMDRYDEIFGVLPEVNGFVASPWIVLMDTTAIPSLATTLGAFVVAPSDANKRPILVINTSQITPSTSRIDTLGTMAHEIYHGISYYYKMVVHKKTLETVALDEGIAHVMEDIFGNSAKIETGWTSSFIGAALDSLYPVLNDWATGFSVPQARGGAHSFMYFLTDMFGGLSLATATAANPTVSAAASVTASGSGIFLLRDLIRSPNIGVSNIEAITGFKMPQLIGDYAATVILDQSSIKSQSERWSLKAPFSLTAISGDKVDIGHRFSYDVSTLSDLGGDDLESAYYVLNGFLWTQAGTKKLEFGSVQPNTGLTLVRIK